MGYEGIASDNQTINKLYKKAHVNIEEWRNLPSQSGKYTNVCVDGIYLRQN